MRIVRKGRRIYLDQVDYLSLLWAKPSLDLSRSVSSGPQAPKLGTDLG